MFNLPHGCFYSNVRQNHVTADFHNEGQCYHDPKKKKRKRKTVRGQRESYKVCKLYNKLKITAKSKIILKEKYKMGFGDLKEYIRTLIHENSILT